MSDYAHSESLVSTQWLEEHLNDANTRVIEITWGSSPAFGRPAYEKEHVPGALAWDFENDLKNNVNRDFPDKNNIEALLSKSGITAETGIVLYSGISNITATYAFWLLKIYGHNDVRLLDGDREKWISEKRPCNRTLPTIAYTKYLAHDPDWSIRAGRNDVLRSINDPDCILVDARSIDMYQGIDKSGAARGGHIPGAINFPAVRETNVDSSFKAWNIMTVLPDRSFRAASDLRKLFGTTGISDHQEIIVYCVRGGLSTHAWFVMTQLLGYKHVREYDASWMEWGSLEGFPVEVSE